MSPHFWDAALTCRTTNCVCASVWVCVRFLGGEELKAVMEEVMLMVMVMTVSRNSSVLRSRRMSYCTNSEARVAFPNNKIKL